MEEKSDRQDAISSGLEGAQARLEDVEASVVSLTEELDHSSEEMRVRAYIAPACPTATQAASRFTDAGHSLAETAPFQTHGQGETSGKNPQLSAL